MEGREELFGANIAEGPGTRKWSGALPLIARS